MPPAGLPEGDGGTGVLLDGDTRLEQVEVREDLAHRKEQHLLRQTAPEGVDDRPCRRWTVPEVRMDLAGTFLVMSGPFVDEVVRPAEDLAVARQGATDVQLAGATKRLQVVDQRP